MNKDDEGVRGVVRDENCIIAFQSVGSEGISWDRLFFDEVLDSYLSQCCSGLSKFDFGSEPMSISILVKICPVSSEMNGKLEQR